MDNEEYKREKRATHRGIPGHRTLCGKGTGPGGRQHRPFRQGGKKGQPYSATYAATKAGLIAWTSSVRAELHRTGVSASVICPGFISDVGMFAVYKKAAPKFSGESKPEKVGEAVIRAIKKDLQEVVVNPSSIKPMTILDALNPEITTKLFRKTGLHEFYRGQAQDNLKKRQDKSDK